MPRRNHRATPSLVIRVADRDNKLASHVKAGAGWAVGFVQAKCRQLDAQLRARNNGRLPPRTFHWAIPNKSVKRIILKVDVLTQSWFAKIIVDANRAGDLIMIPWDNLTGERPQILVQSAGTGGPYAVTRDPPTEPGTAFVAGNFDWKGRKRTTDFDGNPLDRPVTDVITWLGPTNRVGPTWGGSTLVSRDMWKDGLLYAICPVGERVVASAIQARGISNLEQLGDRKHIVVTNTDTSTGGPLGKGIAQWKVYTRPEETIADPLRDPGIWHPDTNPNGWKLIGTIDSPDDFSGQRWQRLRMWFFNRSGNQCSTMLPVNHPGDVTLKYDGGGGTLVNRPTHHPMRTKLAAIDIDAFAETVSITIEDEEPTFTHTVARSVTGCSETFPEAAASTLSSWGVEGSGRRVSVDYKGDTRVFATTTMSSEGTDSRAGSLGASYSVSTSVDVTISFQLQLGPTIVNLGTSTTKETASMSGPPFPGTPSGSITKERITNGVVDAPFFPAPNGGVAVLYADLREDVAIVSYGLGEHRIETSSSADIISANVSPGAVSAFWDPRNLSVERTVSQEATINNDSAASYDNSDTVNSTPSGVGVFGSSAPWGENCSVLEIQTFDLVSTLYLSLESFYPQNDASVLLPSSGFKTAYAATDTAGNTALSVRTFSGFFIDIGPDDWTPDGDEWITFITGDDTLLDVMNQIEHVLPGVDGDLPSGDDVTLPPVADD